MLLSIYMFSVYMSMLLSIVVTHCIITFELMPAGGRDGRLTDRRRAGSRGLGTVPEAYESETDNPRQGAPKPAAESRRMKQELERAGDEIAKLQQVLPSR